MNKRAQQGRMEPDSDEKKNAKADQEPANPTSATARLNTGFSIFAHGFC
jgi:hypothetical protein